MTSIVHIESAGPSGRARRITLSGHDEPIATSGAVVKALGISVGDDIDHSRLESLIAEAETDAARDRAHRMLGYRDRSRAEIVRTLRGEGYSADCVTDVVERLAELSLIDDHRYASAYVRTRLSAGYGVRRITRELAERGIGEDVAAQALREETSDTDEVARARHALRGAVPRDRKERDRLVRRLLARGFSPHVAYEAVREPDAT